MTHVRAEGTIPAPPAARSAETTSGAETSRRFVWPPDHRATYYDVQFFRNGTKIFQRRAKQAELTLPPTWKYRGRRYALAAGRYRWIVRPGYGAPRRGDLGQAIVRSSLVVA